MWICPKCGEKAEDQFDSCWRCSGHSRDYEPAGQSSEGFWIYPLCSFTAIVLHSVVLGFLSRRNPPVLGIALSTLLMNVVCIWAFMCCPFRHWILKTLAAILLIVAVSSTVTFGLATVMAKPGLATPHSRLAEAAESLTNDIPISQTIRMSISDEFDGDLSLIVKDREVIADRQLFWTLLYISTNRPRSVVFKGMSSSFHFKLTTTNGMPVFKTAKGKAMSAGPKSLTNLDAGGRVVRASAGRLDFPALTELFVFPSNGVYVFELQYWMWKTGEKRFVLSDPIRVRAVKQDTNSPPREESR